MTKQTKPRYELRPRSESFVGLWEGKHCLCAICINTTRGALDAQLILLAMNSREDLIEACEDALKKLTWPIYTDKEIQTMKPCRERLEAAINKAKPK